MVIVMEFLGDCELMDGGLVQTGVVSNKVRSMVNLEIQNCLNSRLLKTKILSAEKGVRNLYVRGILSLSN